MYWHMAIWLPFTAAHIPRFLTMVTVSSILCDMMKNHIAISLLKAKHILGSYDALGRVCGVSGKAVMKWVGSGRLPRTEYTGETTYAQAIELATNGTVTIEDLRPEPPTSPSSSSHTSLGKSSTIEHQKRISPDSTSMVTHYNHSERNPSRPTGEETTDE